MEEQIVTGLDPTFRQSAHEVEPSTWRIGLDLELAIRGARGQAEPAMNAGVEMGALWRVLGVEPADVGSPRGLSAHARSIASVEADETLPAARPVILTRRLSRGA